MATKRIEYIDAMRGFTMLLVVYSHILVFSYENTLIYDLHAGGLNLIGAGEGNALTFNSLFVLFRMPLFFFISGFILYKNDYIWNIKNSMVFIGKKSKIQLIPTVVFMALYIFCFDLPIANSFLSSGKQGYWFTFSLFEYFCIYVLYRFICHKLGKENGYDIPLIILALLIYFGSFPQAIQLIGIEQSKLIGIFSVPMLKYFLFFVFGTIVKKHFNNIQNILDNGYVTGAGISLFFVLTIYLLHNGYFTNVAFNHIVLIIIALLGVLIVFCFFRKYQLSFTSETKLGSILQYIGRRTLDIYLIHYFFLPQNLDMVGKFFADNVNPAIEFAVSLILALVIVALCLIISNVIRISPILGHYLFGSKLPEK